MENKKLKGTLTKKINGTWVVRVQSTDQPPSPSVVEHGVEYPLHPSDHVTNKTQRVDGKEVEFEIVKEYIDTHTNQVQAYAKLINRNSIGNDGLHFDEGSTYPPVVDKLDKFMDNMELFERSTLMNILEELIKESKAPLYTEEQVRKAIFEALALVYHQSTIGVRIEDVNEIIQSLKQPKKD